MDPADRIGTLLRETYRIERVLGEGGMGVVFVATHERLGNEVAIKFLQPELARDEDTLARFFEEARAAARLNHPNVIRVHDVDTDSGVPFMVMELLEGRSLADLLEREGPLSSERATALIAPILAALEVSHEAGIVHRDIKPDNIFLAVEGDAVVPKLLDFGIAKLRDGERKTATGVAIGTPAYMAPEQAAGRPSAIGPWTDVWSIAVVLFEAVSGRMHYEIEPNGGMMAWLSRLATEPPRRLTLTAPSVPKRFAEAVDAALELSPEDRTRSAAALRAALTPTDAEHVALAPTLLGEVPATLVEARSVPPTEPMVTSRPSLVPVFVALGALVAMLVGVGAWSLLSLPPEEAPTPPTRPLEVSASPQPATASPSAAPAPPSTSATPPEEVVAPVLAEPVPTPTELGGALRAAPEPPAPRRVRRPRPRGSASTAPVRSRTGDWSAEDL